MKYKFKDIEQWARTNRRLTMLPKEFFIPSELEVEDMFFEEDKIEVLFAQDASGSCWHLKDRFFKAGASLPEKRFIVDYVTFDTKVFETSIKSRKIYGGGGTSFSCIEEYIQRKLRSGKMKKYSTVFLITDCFGDKVHPQFPDKWHIFMTENHSDPSYYFPQNCHFYNLRDFE